MNITHFHLQSAAIDESVAFYTEYMGFRELGRQNGSAFLRDENGFDFVIDDVSTGDAIPPSIHIGFRQKTPEDVKACYETLKDKVEIISDFSEGEGFSLFTFRDPDQMQVEIFYSAL